MNDYDKTGRFLAKRDAEDFFRWWLGNPRANFHAWIDARRVALPNQGDLSNDKGLNMQTSPFFDEIRAEGREEGRAEVARTLVQRLGLRKFGKGPTKKQLKELERITDQTQLEALAERVLDAKSWGDLLAEL
jgi:hypothetical protein